MPAGAKEVRSDAGNTIPMVFVTTADGSKGIEGISYARLKDDMRDAARELRKKLETVDVLGAEVEEEPETPTSKEASESSSPAMLSQARAWTNAEGKEITASVKSVENGNVLFIMNGKEVSYPLSKLSEESRKAIEELAK